MKMKWKQVLSRYLEIGLRVPPLFMMDAILNKHFLHHYYPYDSMLTWLEISHWFVMMTGFFLLAVAVFCLNFQNLVELYSYLISLTVIVTSYWFNSSFVNDVEKMQDHPSYEEKGLLRFLTNQSIYDIGYNLCMQMSFSQIFILLRTSRQSYRVHQNNNRIQIIFQALVYVSFNIPVICKLTYNEDSVLFFWSPLFTLAIPIIQTMIDFYRTVCYIYSVLDKALSDAATFFHHRDIQDFLSYHWDRLKVPKVLRLFFVIRLLKFMLTFCLYTYWINYKDSENVSYWDICGDILKSLLIDSCSTLIAVLGLTSIVSLAMYYVGRFMSYCLGTDTEEDKTIGTVCAVLFFVLALQTGLTSLEAEQRLLRLYKNFCLLSTSVLHFVHGMVNPQLQTLSAAGNSKKSHHYRALGMCLFLVLFALLLLVYLWHNNTINTWLLAVTAFCIEVILKVVFSLLVYALFMIDSHQEEFWEKLDDYVYYVKSTGNTIEFLFGIFLFCNGAWIMLFESGGVIRAFMMCIHAYFNIFLQAKEGWKIFMRRRTAVNKINRLPVATERELEEHNDVCAICYNQLLSARITYCRHFFHSGCLQKWLYVQDTCPFCHKQIYNNTKIQNDQGELIVNQAIPLPYNPPQNIAE